MTNSSDTGGRGRRSKLLPLDAAAALVKSGDRIAFGGFTIYNRPMAFVRELVRRKVSDLTVVAMTAGQETEMLAIAGCLARLETSYVGLEKFGLAAGVRRLAQSGRLEIVDYSEVVSFDRFRAEGDNETFVAVDYLGGNSILRDEAGIVAFKCPLSGRQLFAIPPASPDVTIIHVPAADRYGNGLVPSDRIMPQELDILMAHGSRKLILTTERLVETSELSRVPAAVQIPAFRTAAVVLAPWGCHPGPMNGYYETDESAFALLADSGRTENASADYLRETVFEHSDHADYLKTVGIGRLIGGLRRRA